VVEDSVKARNWTVPRVENGIKSAFFGRGVELATQEDEVSLRYTDLKRAIGATEGPVADKTLSRALRAMNQRGQLQRNRKGREVYYRLTIPRAEKLAAFAKSDSGAIQAAARVGGVGDVGEGWAFYGVPDLLKEKVRKRLERASRRFRSEMGETIERLLDETISSGIRRARGRMPRSDLWRVEDTLYHVFQTQATGALVMVRASLLWSNLESIFPGSLVAAKRALGIPDLPDPNIEWTDAHSDAIAKATGVPPEVIRSAVARETKRLEKARPLLTRFFELLGPEEGNRFGEHINAIVAMVATLTAVTRV